jgi:hypothetical protein
MGRNNGLIILPLRYGFGDELPNSKGIYEKTTENWCEIRVWFIPITGNLQAQSFGGKVYPAQGVGAYWSISSTDEKLNTLLKEIIKNTFESLDRFETEVVIGK